ncbi:MAG: transposase [Planctomycetota bacterium]
MRAEVRHQDGRHTHPTAGCLDAQRGKTTAIGARRGYDAGTHIHGRTRHLLVDTLGWILVIVVPAASVSTPAGAQEVFTRLGGAWKTWRVIWVDETSQGRLVAWVADHRRVLRHPV